MKQNFNKNKVIICINPNRELLMDEYKKELLTKPIDHTTKVVDVVSWAQGKFINFCIDNDVEALPTKGIHKKYLVNGYMIEEEDFNLFVLLNGPLITII